MTTLRSERRPIIGARRAPHPPAAAEPVNIRTRTPDTMRFTVATYNIHKGFTQLSRRMVIHELRDRLHGLAADIVFLQEVVGVHRGRAARHQDWPVKPQHEFIAEKVWGEVAYG